MMNLDKNIAKKFSRYAESYHERSFVQKEIAAELFDYVINSQKHNLEPVRILDIGCGSGHLTKLVSEQFPDSLLYSIDISEKMIETAKKNIGEKNNVVWLANDFMDEEFEEGFFDLIVSSSALHWIFDKKPFVKIYKILKTGGRFFAAIMTEGTLKELHKSKAAVAPEKESSAKMPSVLNILDDISKAGIDIKEYKEETRTVYYDNATDVIYDIKSQGLTGGAYSYGKDLLTRRELKDMLDYYNKNFFVKDKGVSLTYNMLYIAGEKKDK